MLLVSFTFEFHLMKNWFESNVILRCVFIVIFMYGRYCERTSQPGQGQTSNLKISKKMLLEFLLYKDWLITVLTADWRFSISPLLECRSYKQVKVTQNVAGRTN